MGKYLGICRGTLHEECVLVMKKIVESRLAELLYDDLHIKN